MGKKISFLFLFFVFPILLLAQKQQKVLFTVDNSPVYTKDFKRMYLKNLKTIDTKSETNIDSYLDLYIDYSLKVKEAKTLGLDTTAAFKNEFKKYRRQLAKKYISESKVTETLVKEAYERMQTAVNASHILIRVPPNAPPEDSLRAYKKILEIRQEILDGKPFGKAATVYSEDMSGKKNGGKLGWFSVFKMVYPFETAAYRTNPGEVSMPVRTQFGYHLVKVNDKRPAKGKIKVAHIMLVEKKEDSIDPAEQIHKIYDMLQNGATFEEMAKKYSDHKSSAVRGGELKPFAPSELNSESFQEVAFSIEKINTVSKPFQTKFGWHIVKLIEKFPVGSLEDERTEIEAKIKNDSRSRLVKKSLLKNLRKKYEVEKEGVPEFFYNFVGDSVLTGAWKMDTTKIPQKTLIKIGDAKKTYRDFAYYISERQKTSSGGIDKNWLVDQWYEDFTNNFMLAHYRKNLGKTNPEFATIAEEYYNGLLIFDLMEQKIWNAAKKDSLGLQAYFKKNKKNYNGKELDEVRGLVVSDYQNHLEEKWLARLRKKYTIQINQKALEKLKESLE